MEVKIERLEMTDEDRNVFTKNLSLFKKVIYTIIGIGFIGAFVILYLYGAKFLFFADLGVMAIVIWIYISASKQVRQALKENKKIRVTGAISKREIAVSASTVSYEIINNGKTVRYKINHPSGLKEIEEDLDTPKYLREKELFYFIYIGDDRNAVTRDVFFKLHNKETASLEKTVSGIFIRCL